ncbi:hypothetical protein [Burkholderia sp. Ac-20365]|uniref:hypothetical protein n=1 Tax=Burkholderia sp. Ac-20365 TaxID=2703897 RepID=UPI00197B8C1C|nr:hypothetical protein [Burkholderia sp. Ac-20365]MBN3760952.1 hypothetical protein [Burkholderia sp. Ac-20365]
MAASKTPEWTYERFGDAISCLRESLETLYDTLKRSEPIEPEVRAAFEKEIASLEKLRDSFSQTRDNYYRVHLFAALAGSLDKKVVAPFGSAMSGNP